MNNVMCERNCKSKDKNGRCTLQEIKITRAGECFQYKAAPEFEPIRADNVVIYDNAGIPSVMVKFSRMTNSELFGGSEKVHPMFKIGNDVYDEVYISKYPNIIINGKAYSLPMQKPAVNVTLEEAEKACFSKGEGWHLLTAAERGFLANLCLNNGTLPHGNTNYGKYHGNTKEKGECYDGYKTLTGSGPETWNHDHTVFGVSDLCGNVWELFRGLRLKDGVLQVAENNDAALNIDLSERSDKWVCLTDEDGEPIRIDAGNGGIKFTTEGEIDEDYSGCSWKNVEFDFEITEDMKALGLYAGEPDAYICADANGERLPLAGGGWAHGAYAGVFGLTLSDPRSYSNGSIGFRSAYFRKLDTEN